MCRRRGGLYNINSSNIGQCLRMERNQPKGFQFIYKKDFDTSVIYKHKPINTQRKPVVQLDLNGNLINIFNSIGQADDKKVKL